MASISSMKMMQGAFSFACLNRSRTRAAPTPTNISTKSEPERLKNGTPASPATAFASSVLPVPGGPTRSTPFGSLPPSLVNRFGYLRNSTTSSTSSFASSSPATSLKVSCCPSIVSKRIALFFPMLSTCWPGPPIRRIRKSHRKTRSARGKTHARSPPNQFSCVLEEKLTACWASPFATAALCSVRNCVRS